MRLQSKLWIQGGGKKGPSLCERVKEKKWTEYRPKEQTGKVRHTHTHMHTHTRAHTPQRGKSS